MSADPNECEDVVRQIYIWISKMAEYAHVEFYNVVMETYYENRSFWHLLPELFVQIFRK